MFVVIGRVRIKPGQEELTRQMLNERGVHMFEGTPGFSMPTGPDRSARLTI